LPAEVVLTSSFFPTAAESLARHEMLRGFARPPIHVVPPGISASIGFLRSAFIRVTLVARCTSVAASPPAFKDQASMTPLTQTPESTGEVEELRQRVALAEAAQARAEAALRQSEERFHAFLHHSPCVAFLKDGAGRIVYGNAGLDRLLSTPNQHFLGKTDYDL